MPRCGILQFARMASTRIPMKLVKHVGGRRLIDIGLRYLLELKRRTGAIPVIACPPGDTPIIEAASGVGIDILPVVVSESFSELISSVAPELRQRFDIVWDANLLCRPFLSLSVGVEVVGMMETIRALVFTEVRRGLLWDESGTVIHGQGRMGDSRLNPAYQAMSHLGYLYPTSLLSLVSESELAAACQPSPITLGWRDRIDIDTFEDLSFARAVAAMEKDVI